MGDMEFDAMDDMDYGDDYESGIPEDTSDSRDNLRDQESELDQVARHFAKRFVGGGAGGWVARRVFLAQLRSDATFTKIGRGVLGHVQHDFRRAG